MPYNRRIKMSLDQAKQETRAISQELEAKEGQQDDAVQAVVEHISKIDNENGKDEIRVVPDNSR